MAFVFVDTDPVLVGAPPPPPQLSPPPHGPAQPYSESLGPLLGLTHVDRNRFATAIEDFNGSEWGKEYVSFARGARILSILAD